MQSKLESLDDYTAKSDTCDCSWILKEIQGITHRFEGTRNVFISLDGPWTNYYIYRQGNQQTVHEYLKDYQGLVQVLEHCGAALGAEAPYQDALKAQIKIDHPGLTTAEYRARTTLAAKKKSATIGCLKRADRQRYGGLWSELENLFTRGQDHYPTDLTSPYNLLLNCKAPPMTQPGQRNQQRDDEEVNDSLSYRMEPPFRVPMAHCMTRFAVTTARASGITPAFFPKRIKNKEACSCYKQRMTRLTTLRASTTASLRSSTSKHLCTGFLSNRATHGSTSSPICGCC
jgi:hypothetical protein